MIFGGQNSPSLHSRSSMHAGRLAATTARGPLQHCTNNALTFVNNNVNQYAATIKTT